MFKEQQKSYNVLLQYFADYSKHHHRFCKHQQFCSMHGICLKTSKRGGKFCV